ncbi:MAG: CPBP family intramembrane metalloprotease [Defluviitaleaceae bacterium]|nr:CPBP family intramembrane metalloprotease [Defluviitaleaceae bacterium]
MTPRKSNRFMLLMFLWFIIASVILVTLMDFVTLSPGMGLFAMQVLGFGIPVAVALWLNRGRIKDILPMQKLGILNILMIFGMTITLVPVLTLVATISQLFFTDYITETANEIVFEYNLLWALFFIGIVPSFFEELVFRGVIFSGYKKAPVIQAALVNGLFFGIIHMNMQQFFFTAVAGFVWFLFVYYTRSIWAGIWAHIINNTIQVFIAFFVMNAEDVAYDYYTPEISSAMAMLTLGIFAAFSLGLFLAIYTPFKVWNGRRNVQVNADIETVEERQPIITKSLVIVTILFAMFMILMEVV